MSKKYKDSNIYDLAYELDPTDAALCGKIDPYLSKKLETLDELFDVYYYLCYGNMHDHLVKTKAKINELFNTYLNDNEDNLEWWKFKNFSDWLDGTVSERLVTKWLDSDSTDNDSAWIANNIPDNSDLSLKALNKIVNIYKKNRSIDHVKTIEKIFANTTGEYISGACEIVSKATPAVAACLLSRDDIADAYTLKGLKALSKLSKQRKIDIKVEFGMLKNLGPKSRLDAMKQLLGMLDKYYLYNKRLEKNKSSHSYGYSYRNRNLKEVKYSNPFKTIPTRSEVETFLFPCSLKYNEQVVDLVKKFDDLITKKG